jgi:hypothetical protein
VLTVNVNRESGDPQEAGHWTTDRDGNSQRGAYDALQVHPQDGVLVALRGLQPGEPMRSESEEVIVRAAVSRGYKITVTQVAAGVLVRKYGCNPSIKQFIEVS